MNFSPTSRRTSVRGFTLVEMMVAASVFTVVGVAILSVLISTMQLSSANAVTNLSNFRARQTLERIEELIRYAQDTPVLINSDGSIATGQTADGVLVKNALGGPYVFKNANGRTDDIPSGATSFMVEYAPAAGVTAPVAGDYFLLNLSTQPELEVVSVVTASAVGSLARVQVTTKTGITETAKPDTYTVSAYRYHKEAYLFAQSGNQWNLRHYATVTSSTPYASATSYRVLGMGFQKLGNQAWFSTVTDNGTQALWLRAVARSSDHAEYTESLSGQDTLTSMPLQGKLWNYNAPPPAE